MQILVLTKPVPDPAAGAERLTGSDLRLDRSASPTVVNGNDEYALEAALQLVEAHGGEVAILSMAPANATETMRKALAMGAQRGTHVTDPALEGADLPTTIRVLAAAAAQEPFDLLLTGLDTSDGTGGVVAAGVAQRLGLPLLSAAAAIEPDPAAGTRPGEAAERQGATTSSRRRCPRSIACTQALGAPRYPSLKGIMAARSREIATRSLADLGAADDGPLPPTAAGARRGRWPPTRRRRGPTGRVVKAPAADAAREIADFLASRRLI